MTVNRAAGSSQGTELLVNIAKRAHASVTWPSIYELLRSHNGNEVILLVSCNMRASQLELLHGSPSPRRTNTFLARSPLRTSIEKSPRASLPHRETLLREPEQTSIQACMAVWMTTWAAQAWRVTISRHGANQAGGAARHTAQEPRDRTGRTILGGWSPLGLLWIWRCRSRRRTV